MPSGALRIVWSTSFSLNSPMSVIDDPRIPPLLTSSVACPMTISLKRLLH